MSLRLNEAEAIELQGATVFVFESDARQGTGCLFLEPGASLDKHNRPVEEWLVQIEGESVVKLFNDNKVDKEVLLKRGDSLRILANQYHQHTNVSSKESLISWHFDGNITEVVNKLRSS